MVDAIVDRTLDEPRADRGAGRRDGRGARWPTTAAPRWLAVLGAERADALSDAEMNDSMVYCGVPQLPSVGCLQPHRLPVPARTATVTTCRSWSA